MIKVTALLLTKVEFVSLGGLVKGLTIDDIMGGVFQSRNSVLAGVFYRLELIEGYGKSSKQVLARRYGTGYR